jgi:hypothetical protein
MRRTWVFCLGLFCTGSFLYSQPVITAAPEDKTALEGRTVTLAVEAQGSGRLSYQWQFNGEDIPRAQGRALRMRAVRSRAGTYSVVVRDITGQAVSTPPARLEVQKRPVVIRHPSSVVIGEHQNATFEVVMNDSGPYESVQWYHHSPEEPFHPIPPSAAVGVNTLRLTVENATRNGTYNGLYSCAVTNRVGGVMSRRATLTVVEKPRFLAEPQDRLMRRGGTAVFSVTVAPDPAPTKTLQWFFNDQPIPGATRRYIRVRNVQDDDVGYYHCVVTSVGGVTRSYAARLDIQ